MLDPIWRALHFLFVFIRTCFQEPAPRSDLTEKVLNLVVAVVVGLVPFATFKLGLRSSLRARRADRFKEHVTDVSISKVLAFFYDAETPLLRLIKIKDVSTKAKEMARFMSAMIELNTFISTRLSAFGKGSAMSALVGIWSELRQRVQNLIANDIVDEDASERELMLILRTSQQRVVDIICSCEETAL